MLFLITTGGLLYAGVRAYRHLRRPTSVNAEPDQPPIAPQAPTAESEPHLQISRPEVLPSAPESLLTQLGVGTGQVAQMIVDKLAGSDRQKYEQELARSGQEGVLSEEERQANLFAGVSVVCLGLTTAGQIFYPPLALLSIPGLIYTATPFVMSGFNDLRTQRRFTASTLDLIAIPTLLLMGNLFASALTVSLLSLSQAVVKRTEERSMQSMIDVFGQQPTTVWALVGDEEVEIPFATLQTGDLLVVTAGQMLPADGVIIGGVASIDQRMLTGESQPSEKTVGDEVFAASLLLAGRILVKVERAGEATIAAKIGAILRETVTFKQSFETRSKMLSDRWSLPTLVISGLALPLHGLGGSVAVLISSLGYNLRIVGPLSMLNFLRLAAQRGVLVKAARALEILPTIDTVVFDKTGTLTLEQPEVRQIYTYSDWSADDLLRYAAAAEQRQSHPIARAILDAAHQRGLTLPAIAEARYEVGYGIKVGLDGLTIRVGSERFMQMECIEVPAEVSLLRSTVHELGHSLVLISIDSCMAGAIELAPTLRPEARQIINTLHERGLSLYILSGDQEQPTRHLAQTLGIEHYMANTLPEQKADRIRQLQAEGRRICFIGDGINDAIALQQADISISLRGASTIATDTAQIVLMDGDLDQLTALFDLADKYKDNMRGNYVASMAPGMVVIGGVFLLHFGVITSIMLYNIGLIAGIVNAMSPLLNGQSQLSASHEQGAIVDAETARETHHHQ